MFIAAIARPCFDPTTGECLFDGKIGLWPLVTKTQAERKSVNRPKGTWETKGMKVNKELYRDYLCNKVVPAIRAKWPRGTTTDRRSTIFIQQDNASPHIAKADEDWVEATRQTAGQQEISFRPQPPNSPDTNMCDLGFFVSLQSISKEYKASAVVSELTTIVNADGTTSHHRRTPVDVLIDSVQQAWDQYTPEKLNRIWLTHESVLSCIIEDRGGNDFDILHMSKEKLARQGVLPLRICLTNRASAYHDEFI